MDYVHLCHPLTGHSMDYKQGWSYSVNTILLLPKAPHKRMHK